MSSACPQVAKNIFSDTKRRLSERVCVNINNSASVAREMVRGLWLKFSKKSSHEINNKKIINFQDQNRMIFSWHRPKVSLNKKFNWKIAQKIYRKFFSFNNICVISVMPLRMALKQFQTFTNRWTRWKGEGNTHFLWFFSILNFQNVILYFSQISN